MKIETFDTETVDGKAFLIASSKHISDISSFTQAVEFIFSHDSNISFAFNMDYDASAILKFLSSREIDKLYLHNKLNVNGYFVQYIPSKIFRLSNETRTIEMFDLMQFYNMSLENAAQKILGEGKSEIPLEVKTNLGEFYPKPEWRDVIRHYCIRDAKLTYKLAHHFLNMLSQAGVDARKFYSTGYLAGRYLNKVKPGRLPDDAVTFIQPSYYGGRNECTQRGMIPRCYIYDIKSAYPSVIRTLKTLKGARYSMGRKPDVKADYKFINAKLWLKPGRFIYPIPWKEKRKGFIFYPCLTGQEVTITGPEWDILMKYDLIEKIKNVSVMNIHTRDEKPFSFVDELFEERKKSDSHNYIYKLILNSIYGKFYEKRNNVELMNGNEMYRLDISGSAELQYRKYLEYAKTKCKNAERYYEKKCSCPNCVALIHIANFTRWKRKKSIDPIVVRKDNGDFQYYRKKEHGGKRFNILYASYITASIRAKIYDAACSVGTDFVACFTDSIFSLSKLSDKFISDEIGMFELKGIAENLVMVGTGVYEYDVTNEEGTKQYTRFRGFKRNGGLREILDSESKEIELTSLQRISWGTIVQQTKTWYPDDFNKLVHQKRNLHVNFDHKRIWSLDFENGKHVLSRRIVSKPREI